MKTAGDVALTANTAATDTITITNTQGNTATAINLEASAGGILASADGNINSAIKLHATAGANQTIDILNTAGIDNAAIALTATAGGIALQANGTSPNGQISIDSTNSQVVIAGGTTTTIKATTGALTLEATAESVNIKTGTNKPIEINGEPGAAGSVLTSNGSALAPTWGAGSTPIGAIMMWTTGTAPINWAICDGNNYNGTATGYPTLNTALGGGGTATETLPDMRGLFVRGKTASGGEALKSTQGAANNKITTNHLVEHKHDITDLGHDHGGNTGNTNTAHTHTLGKTQGIGTAVFGAAQTDSTWPTGSGQGQESTSSAGGNHLHSIPSGTTGITETDNDGGVAAASQAEYAPLHYVINYIIYKGPLGA